MCLNAKLRSEDGSKKTNLAQERCLADRVFERFQRRVEQLVDRFLEPVDVLSVSLHLSKLPHFFFVRREHELCAQFFHLFLLQLSRLVDICNGRWCEAPPRGCSRRPHYRVRLRAHATLRGQGKAYTGIRHSIQRSSAQADQVSARVWRTDGIPHALKLRVFASKQRVAECVTSLGVAPLQQCRENL